MSDFGLTPQGFKRKKYDDIITDMEASARNLFGENVNLSERGPLGLMLRLVAWVAAGLWQLAEDVYHSSYIDTAEGVPLASVGKNIGQQMRAAEKAVWNVTFAGDQGTVIPIGLLVGTKDEILFATTEEVTIEVDGTVATTVKAVEPGISGNVPTGTISEIIQPIAGLDSVTNTDLVIKGRDAETDEEFRNRYYQSGGAVAGAATTDGVRATLLEVHGVRAAITIQNTSMEVDAEGRPPKSIHCYVLGGAPGDVANAILESKAGGIETYGDEVVTVKDLSGQDQVIKFSYAEVVPTYIRLAITTNAKYPVDGDAQITTALVRYIGGEDSDGTIYSGLAMKEKVVYFQLTKVAGIEGVDDLDLEVSIDGVNWNRNSIEIASNQKAETSYDKVVITHA